MVSSITPGGLPAAWPAVRSIFQAIAARKAPEATPTVCPCCDWVGENGAGHFVKMVHNGIEYGDIQIIAEAYQLMQEALGLSNDEMSAIFDEWNGGKLKFPSDPVSRATSWPTKMDSTPASSS